MSHNLDSQHQRHQHDFERKIFHAGNFSEIHKYLKSIRRGTQLTSEMYLEDRKVTTDEEKSDLFNTFSQSVVEKFDYQTKNDKIKLVRIDKKSDFQESKKRLP